VLLRCQRDFVQWVGRAAAELHRLYFVKLQTIKGRVGNTNGTARMAVAQPVGATAVEVLTFNDPTAGKPGPIGWQMHNKGLFDEYKDVRVEENPKQATLITTE